MSDHTIRGIFRRLGLRVVACETTELCQLAAKKQQCAEVSAVALGRALTAAALLGSNLKGNERLGLQISGSGPIRGVFADVDAFGRVRGYVSNPTLPSLELMSLAEALGERGIVNVLREDGSGEFYRGLTQLVAGTVDRDIENYLCVSEQVPSVLALGVITSPQGIEAAGGLLLQALPGGSVEALSDIRKTVSSDVLESYLTQHRGSARDLTRALLTTHTDDLEILGEPSPVLFFCPCSRERAERTLMSLGPLLLDEIIAEDRQTTVTCEFCRRSYPFHLEELLALKGALAPAGEA